MRLLDLGLLALIVVALYWVTTKRRRRHIVDEIHPMLPGASIDLDHSQLFRFPKATRGAKPHYIVFDTETSHCVSDEAPEAVCGELVALGWILLDQDMRLISEERHLLTSSAVTPEAMLVHGYTGERLSREGEPAKSVLEQFRQAYERCEVGVAHCAAFHLRQIATALKHAGLPPLANRPVLCTEEIGLARLYNTTTDRAHIALEQLYSALYFAGERINFRYSDKCRHDLLLVTAVLQYLKE